MSKAKFALGTLIGAGIGLVVGILTAPKSGKETRTELKTKADVMKADAMKKAADMKAEAIKKAESAQTRANEVAGDVKDKANGVAQDVKVRTDDLKGRTERAVDGARKGFANDK